MKLEQFSANCCLPSLLKLPHGCPGVTAVCQGRGTKPGKQPRAPQMTGSPTSSLELLGAIWQSHTKRESTLEVPAPLLTGEVASCSGLCTLLMVHNRISVSCSWPIPRGYLPGENSIEMVHGALTTLLTWLLYLPLFFPRNCPQIAFPRGHFSEGTAGRHNALVLPEPEPEEPGTGLPHH